MYQVTSSQLIFSLHKFIYSTCGSCFCVFGFDGYLALSIVLIGDGLLLVFIFFFNCFYTALIGFCCFIWKICFFYASRVLFSWDFVSATGLYAHLFMLIFFLSCFFAFELQILLRMELFGFNWSKDVSFVIIYAFMLLWSFVSWSIWEWWTLFNLFGPCIYCLLVRSCMAIGNGWLRYLSTCSYVICFWLTQASDLNSSSVFSDVFLVWFWASVYAFIRCYANGNRIFL